MANTVLFILGVIGERKAVEDVHAYLRTRSIEGRESEDHLDVVACWIARGRENEQFGDFADEGVTQTAAGPAMLSIASCVEKVDEIEAFRKLAQMFPEVAISGASIDPSIDCASLAAFIGERTLMSEAVEDEDYRREMPDPAGDDEEVNDLGEGEFTSSQQNGLLEALAERAFLAANEALITDAKPPTP